MPVHSAEGGVFGIVLRGRSVYAIACEKLCVVGSSGLVAPKLWWQKHCDNGNMPLLTTTDIARATNSVCRFFVRVRMVHGVRLVYYVQICDPGQVYQLQADQSGRTARHQFGSIGDGLSIAFSWVMQHELPTVKSFTFTQVDVNP